MEATARTQGEDELTRDYITCPLVIIRKMEPIPGSETQLDMLHRNLRPALQKLGRRANFKDIDELQELAREAELTLDMEKTFRPPPPPELTMLPEAAYKSRSAKPAKPKISGVNPGEYNGLAGKETSADQSILTAISRLEAGLNELRSKQNARLSGQTQRRKGDHRSQKQKPPSSKTTSREEKEGRTPTGDGKKSDTGGGNDRKNGGPAEPIKCWGCGRIGYRRSFCPDCSGNENRRD